MNGVESKAVIGTNSWGGKAYGKAIRGSYVEDSIIKDAMREAEKQGIIAIQLYKFTKSGRKSSDIWVLRPDFV